MYLNDIIQKSVSKKTKKYDTQLALLKERISKVESIYWEYDDDAHKKLASKAKAKRDRLCIKRWRIALKKSKVSRKTEERVVLKELRKI